MDLNHVVVALTGDRVVKCQCLTCKKTHQFRAPKGVTDPKVAGTGTSGGNKASKTGRTRTKAISVQEEWLKAMEEVRKKPAKPYSIKLVFLVGDRIHHPKFGEGVIRKNIHPNKVEILFQDDLKILICAPN